MREARMNLILWRHAEAEDGLQDEKRKLTAKGRKQALRMAQWLNARLPEQVVVLVSPAVRTQQTAALFAGEFVTSEDVGLSASPDSILRAAGWPQAAHSVVVVGHQPTLGMTAARLLCEADNQWSLRKGAIVWISRKGSENVLRAALSPDLI